MSTPERFQQWIQQQLVDVEPEDTLWLRALLMTAYRWGKYNGSANTISSFKAVIKNFETTEAHQIGAIIREGD